MNAEDYSRIMRKNLWSEYERFVTNLLRRAAPPEGARVLEICPGPGWIGIILAKARPDLRLEAVDASADMVRCYQTTIEAEGLSGRIEPAVGRAERLVEAAQGPFASIYSRDSPHHWEEPSSAFRQIRSALAPGGALFLTDNRRDLEPGVGAIVALLSRFVLGPMGKWWKSSLAAG